jgi:hypothetical protein
MYVDCHVTKSKVQAGAVTDTNSWIWNEGYDIQRESIYRWMCKASVALNRPQFASFKATGLQNAREHLWREHNIGAPEGEKKGVLQLHDENHHQPSIIAHFRLDPLQPREQQMTNTIIRTFDKQHLQRLLIELIVTSNLPFSFVDNGVLHKILKYLNPFISIREAIPSSRTLRRNICRHFNGPDESASEEIQDYEVSQRN